MRNVIVIGLTVAGFALVFACSSTSTGTGSSGTSSSSGGSGSSFKNCGSSSTSSCSQADLDTYYNCIATACDSTLQECFGANYKSGSFGGACSTWITCYQKCNCGDSACTSACGLPDAPCQTCTQKISTCSQNSGCATPACMSTSSSSSSGTTSSTSSSSTSSSSTSSSGGTSKTCADLQTCCDKITDATLKSSCQQAHDGAAGADSTCNAYYAGFGSYCP